MDVLMNVKVVVAILLIVSVPVYAQAQSPSAPKVSEDDAKKVVKIIKGDKAKTQANCEIDKVSEQMNQAYRKNDKKRIDDSFDHPPRVQGTDGANSLEDATNVD